MMGKKAGTPPVCGKKSGKMRQTAVFWLLLRMKIIGYQINCRRFGCILTDKTVRRAKSGAPEGQTGFLPVSDGSVRVEPVLLQMIGSLNKNYEKND